jgi:hypothetical protein
MKPLVASFVLPTVLFLCGHVLAQTQQPAVPSSFFGIHVNNPTKTANETSYPLQVGRVAHSSRSLAWVGMFGRENPINPGMT